jgi:hypothetical protein
MARRSDRIDAGNERFGEQDVPVGTWRQHRIGDKSNLPAARKGCLSAAALSVPPCRQAGTFVDR